MSRSRAVCVSQLMPKLPISARNPNSRSLALISPATYLLKLSDRMYFQTANARVPTIRAAAMIAKKKRLSRRRRGIAQYSADEVDFMIRTNKAYLMNRTGGLIVYKVGAIFKPSGETPCLLGMFIGWFSDPSFVGAG